MTAGPTNSNPLATAYESPQAQSIGGLNLSGLWALYVLTLRQHMHGRRWMVMALLFLLPVGLAIALRISAPHLGASRIEFICAFMFLPQAILPLVALIYASGIIQDEREDQTITYLLVRPIPKWALYTTKLLATITTTIVLTALFTVVVYAVVYVGAGSEVEEVPLRALKAIAVHSLAMTTYCCLFGLLSLLTKRFLLAGIVFVIAIEWVLANFPFGVRYLTIIYYTRLIAYHMMPFTFTVYGHKIDLASDAWQLRVERNPELAGHPTAQTCLLVLAGASLVFTVLAAVICSQREFHVKTPDKE